jgi:hypothetical protein
MKRKIIEFDPIAKELAENTALSYKLAKDVLLSYEILRETGLETFGFNGGIASYLTLRPNYTKFHPIATDIDVVVPSNADVIPLRNIGFEKGYISWETEKIGNVRYVGYLRDKEVWRSDSEEFHIDIFHGFHILTPYLLGEVPDEKELFSKSKKLEIDDKELFYLKVEYLLAEQVPILEKHRAERLDKIVEAEKRNGTSISYLCNKFIETMEEYRKPTIKEEKLRKYLLKIITNHRCYFKSREGKKFTETLIKKLSK